MNCVSFILADHAAVAFDIRIVQGRIDFIDEAEGRGAVRHEGNQKSDDRQGSFAAGHERKRLALLAGELQVHLDTAFQRMRFIGELEARLAAAEHELHDAAKFFIDFLEGFGELTLHRLIDIADDGLEPFPRFCEIRHLIFIECPSRELTGVFLLALRIHTAQLRHAARQGPFPAAPYPP